MRKLLSAGFSRLWRDRIFWLSVGCMFTYALAYMLNGCRQAASMAAEGYFVSIDRYYFQFAVVIGLFAAVFASMFLGTDYSDGTIRNKILVGHTRTDVYLANLILTFTAALLISSAWLTGALAGLPFLGMWEMGIPGLLFYLLIAVMFVAAFSAVFTFVAMLSSNKAATVLICVLLFLGLLVFASVLYEALSQPELANSVEMTADGFRMTDPKPNPAYVGGWKRKLYDFVVDALPTGQGLRMWQREIAHPVRMLVSSLVITVVATLGGIAAFKKKDLR